MANAFACDFCDPDGSGNHAPRCPVQLEAERDRQYDENVTQIAKVAALEAELSERDRSFDLRWNADMRAIERWRAERPAERELTMPDHADLCVWLLEKLSTVESKLDAILAAIRHCAGESSFDSFNFKGGGYCSECGRGTKAGHEALCWRRFAFEEPPR